MRCTMVLLLVAWPVVLRAEPLAERTDAAPGSASARHSVDKPSALAARRSPSADQPQAETTPKHAATLDLDAVLLGLPVEALLKGSGSPIGGLEPAPVETNGVLVGVGSGTVASDPARTTGSWLLVLASFMALVFGGSGLFLVRRGRRVPRQRSAEDRAEGRKQRVEEPTPHERKERGKSAERGVRTCPVCSTEYREEIRFCGRDGAELR